MASKKKGRKLLLFSAIGLAVLGTGIWFATRGTGEPVNVYPFSNIGMTEFWGDTQESYGPVTTDKIQTEFLSDTQTVTQIKVQKGDKVKKGDVLFTFDTTLDALSLERKRLEVEKIKVQIKAAEERLQDTREMVPYEPPKPTEPKEPPPDEVLTEPYIISDRIGKDKEIYNGKTKETAIICWLKDGTSVTNSLLQELYDTVTDYQQEASELPETEKTESSASNAPEDIPGDLEEVPEEKKPVTQIPALLRFNAEDSLNKTVDVGTQIVDAYTYQGKTYWLKSARRAGETEALKDLLIPAYPQEPGEAQDNWESVWEEGVVVEYIRKVSFAGRQMRDGKLEDFPSDNHLILEKDQNVFLEISSVIHDLAKEYSVEYTLAPQNGIFVTEQENNRFYLTGKPEERTEESAEYTVTVNYEFEDNYGQNRAVEEVFTFSVSVSEQERILEDEFYVVFKTTEKNVLKGLLTVWQGAKVTAYEDGTFDMQLFDASGFTDHTLPLKEELEIDLPEINPNAMYTAEQILDMQKQCYATIKEQNEKLKLAESEYAIMQRELGDGNIYAEIDGKVVSVLTEEEAKEKKQPLLKVSGGGGFYIEGSVSELEREKLKIGQEVTVNDWNNGGTYTGEVVSIGDFPTSNDSWNGMGNPTASYYPFKAFVSEEADLQAGSHVSMNYSTASAEQGIYLEKAFVRSENGQYWIYVRGADGNLEKRNVRVGKVLWGSYYEILSPLGENDYLAFPYGKHVKHGAPTVESDLSALYGY